jgi:hypothetical protein
VDSPTTEILLDIDVLPSGEAWAVGSVSDSLATDGSGALSFSLDTSQADVGCYFVTVRANPSATASFALDLQAPLRGREGDGPMIDVPGGIAFIESVYLPLIQRW